jgi:hypothetical protein
MKIMVFQKFLPFSLFLTAGLSGVLHGQAPATPDPAAPPAVAPAVEEPALPAETGSVDTAPQPMILDEEAAPAPAATLPALPATTDSSNGGPSEIPAMDANTELTQEITQPLIDQVEGTSTEGESVFDAKATPNTPSLPPVMSAKKRFQFSTDVRGIYDDNVNYASKNPQKDFVVVVSPRFAMNVGDYIAKDETYMMLNYNPEAVAFLDSTAQDALDHNFKSQMQYAIGKLSVEFDGTLQHLNGATPDQGERAQRDLAALKTTIKYGFGARLEAETSFLYTTGDYDLTQFADYSEYINELLFRYQLSARTKVAVGAGIGKLEIDGFGSQDFQRALAEAIYQATDKFSLKLKAGLDIRDFSDGRQSTPILAINGEYRFTEQTAFGLSVYQDLNASGGSPGQVFTRTGLTASIRHRFGEKFIGELMVGYEKSDYESTGKSETGQPSRSDESFYFRPSLTYQMREDRRFQVYYMHRSNDSGVDGFEFEGNQLGVSAGFDF